MKPQAYDVQLPTEENNDVDEVIQKVMDKSRNIPNKKVHSLSGHLGPVFVVRRCHTNDYCLSGASDRSIKLWNITTGNCLKTYDKGHNHEIFDIAVCNDNKQFASVGGDKQVFIWDVFTGNIIRKFMGHDQHVNCVCYNKFYNVLVTGSYDSTVKIWDLEARNARPLQTLFDFQDSVTRVCVTSDQIICSSVDEKLRIYDIRFGKLKTHSMGAPINGLYACGDDDFVFCTTTENKIYLYDKGEEKIISEYTGSHDTSEFNASVRISTDNSSVICTSEDGYVVFYDLITKKEVSKVHAHSKAVITMDLFNTGEYNEGTDIMITGSLDKTICVWTQEDANSGL